MATTVARLQIFEILVWRMQEDRIMFSQAFRTALGWSINLGSQSRGQELFLAKHAKGHQQTFLGSNL